MIKMGGPGWTEYGNSVQQKEDTIGYHETVYCILLC